ncbi:hypothetical protein FVEN_g7828 [Fusarium venenatum]|nr:hypothetical protein FVEN_g7828 [Fusarium venenatum]
MQFSTIFSLFIAAMGIVATPIDSPTQELDARGNLFPRLEYWGYKNDDDNSVLQNCLSFNNKKCTKDGNNCKWDSAKKELNYY